MDSPRYCRDKVIYTKREALEAKNRRWREDRVPLRIYPCNWCNGWHLTSKNPYLGRKDHSKNPFNKKPYKRTRFKPFNL